MMARRLWDASVVKNQNYSGSSRPVGVEANGEIFLSTDGQGQNKWSMSIGTPSEASNPVPTPSPTRPLDATSLDKGLTEN